MALCSRPFVVCLIQALFVILQVDSRMYGQKKKQQQQSDVYRLEVIIPLTSFAFDSLISNSNRAAQAFPATTQYAATHDAYNTKEFSKDDLSRRHFILKVCCFFLFF